MLSSSAKKGMLLLAGAILCLTAGTVFAAVSGIGSVASQVTTNLSNIAKLITAGSYVAGFGIAVAAIVKFKAHKDTPTQVHLSQPIVLLFVAAALIFIPAVFKTTGVTLFGGVSGVSKISGITSF